MSNRDNLAIRLKHLGGNSQLDRMNKDKLRSLKTALMYSYQSATAILSDGREFKCLINPDKLSMDLDNKILSIPFVGYCLNGGSQSGDIDAPSNGSGEGTWEDMEDLVAVLTYSTGENWEDMVPEEDVEDIPDYKEEDIIIGGEQETGVAEGDIFTWKENGTHWIIYLRHLEETAYFRANIRRCRYELTLGNGSKYWAYVRGPVEQSIVWSQASGNYMNKLNNTVIIYISKTAETVKYFSRFKKIMIDGKPWEVQVVDSISTPGIMEISLKETFSNTIETNVEEAVKKSKENKEPIVEQDGIYIAGPATVYPYETHTYEIKYYSGGNWSIWNESRSNMLKTIRSDDNQITLAIMTGKSGKFTLVYSDAGVEIAALDVTIGSL